MTSWRISGDSFKYDSWLALVVEPHCKEGIIYVHTMVIKSVGAEGVIHVWLYKT
jgi:hypothetical protein